VFGQPGLSDVADDISAGLRQQQPFIVSLAEGAYPLEDGEIGLPERSVGMQAVHRQTPRRDAAIRPVQVRGSAARAPNDVEQPASVEPEN
jgi:hypothetical protein